MSHPAYIAPRVEITELICILNVVRSSVFVVIFPGYSIQPPPTVSRSRTRSSFFDRTLTTLCAYVTINTTGILLRTTKKYCSLLF